MTLIPSPEDQEKDLARMDTMGDSNTSRTAPTIEPTPAKTKDCGCVMEEVVTRYWVHRVMCQTCHEHRNER